MPLVKALLISAAVALASAAQPLPEQAVGILDQRCVQCHGSSSPMSGLKLTSRDQVLAGGTRGPSIKPGDSAGSLLYQAVAQTGKLSMPPGGKLTAPELEIIRSWIDQGAQWPAKTVATKQPAWWAFQKPHRPDPPRDSAPNPIDSFINDKLRKSEIEPAPEAGKLTLLRRACFDLLGLPPTAEQIQSFLNDTAPGSWERTIDSLLASPRYGEKWGRHWLDLARYGDTSGFEQDPYILEGWRYRDYVIKSFNDDKPYDRFAKEQIAGDEIYPEDPEARTGTGFYRVGTNRDMLFKVEDMNAVEKLTDAVDTTSAVFLGLTVGCARCHDHKFDPIPQRDYYRLQAVFAPAVNDRVFLEYNDARFYDISANQREFKLRQIGEQIRKIEQPYKKRLLDAKADRLPEPARTALKTEASKRTPEQSALAAQNPDAVKIGDDEVLATLSSADAERIQAIQKRLVSMFAGYGPPPMAPGIIDGGREAPRTYIAFRGNYLAPGEEVHPGFLTALGGGDIADPPLQAKTTFRRKALAEWTASADNPLFARVMANRIWQYHFGTGLIRTSSDFGVRAGAPSHPELLDWLATEFANRKWSIKAMHRLIMTSQAYRRAADPTPSATQKDPANTLLSHMSRRRLESEEIRDSVLQVTGELNVKMGGSPVVPPLEAEELFGIIGKPENSWLVTPDQEEHKRRTVYLLARRTFQQPMFEAFDSPDGILSCSRRNESTTAPQSLALLNGRFMVEHARLLASKLQTPADAWSRVLGRPPSGKESAAAEAFLSKQASLLGSRPAAMAELVRGLMNLNEFLYVD